VTPTITTQLLKARLGYVSEASHTVGLELSPVVSGLFAKPFYFNGGELAGSVIGGLSPVNTSPNR
jgi:hypothetical protein